MASFFNKKFSLTIQIYYCIIVLNWIACLEGDYMSEYITTNIRLPRELLKALKHKAVEENKSVSQLVREAVFKLVAHKDNKVWPVEKDPLHKIVAIAKSGIKDGSERHDLYLYRKK